MEEILEIANKIIKLKFKNNDLLFLSYTNKNEFEIYLKAMTTYSDLIQYSISKNIKSGIIIIKYKNSKKLISLFVNAKNFYEYTKLCRIKINEFYILKDDVFRNITKEFIDNNLTTSLSWHL